MLENTKLALGTCYSYNTASYTFCLSKFIPSINHVITSNKINPYNAAIKSQSNDVIDALSKNLYLNITLAMQNFDALI